MDFIFHINTSSFYTIMETCFPRVNEGINLISFCSFVVWNTPPDVPNKEDKWDLVPEFMRV